MMIEDGTGTGRKAAVTSDNKLRTQAEVQDGLEVLNEEGLVWSIPMDALAPSGATKFFYITNTGSRDMGIALIRLVSSVAGVFRFTKVTGTAAGGAAIVAVPTKLDSAAPCPASTQTVSSNAPRVSW